MLPILFSTHLPMQLVEILQQASLASHLGVLYMVFFSGIIAYYLYQKAEKILPISRTDIFLYLPPIFTAPVAYFLLKETITAPFLIGCFFIVTGVSIFNFHAHRR
jgi:drug/metabolite transporter (DMT)-like permease